MLPRKIYAIFLSLFACFVFSCAPRPAVKTTDTAILDKSITVSEDELSYFKELSKTGTTAEDRAKANFWIGQYFYNKKNYEQALKYFSYNEKYYPDNQWGFLSVFRSVDVYLDKNEPENAFDKLKFLIEKRYQFSQFQQNVMTKLETTIKGLPEETLCAILDKHVHKAIDEYILYFLCKKFYQENDYDKFYKYSNIFILDHADSNFYEEILNKFRETIKYRPVAANKIGVILPLSGKAIDIGNLVRNGIELALAEYNAGKKEDEAISFIYIDEESKNLEEKVYKAIETDNVIAFIGPVYSKTVKQLLPIMEKNNIVMFSPTAAQQDLVKEKGYFFRNSGSAQGQANAIAKYIRQFTNHKNICTLYSDDNYGQSLNEAFVKKAQSLELNVLKQVGFKPDKNDFREEIVRMGGIDTLVFKDKRAKENINLINVMNDAGERIQKNIINYFKLYYGEKELQLPEKGKKYEGPRIVISLLHFSPRGKNIKKYEIDSEMTNRLSYAIAKDVRVKVIKQSEADAKLNDIGIEPEYLNRETALHVGSLLQSDVVIWAKIVEAESDTIYANFIPEEYVDEKGNTKITYNFKDEDYFNYEINISAISVVDEKTIDEVNLRYSKIKEPRFNPFSIDALYVAAIDRKMLLIKDQLKFYDFDLPVFGSSSLGSNYISQFYENMQNTIYPSEFYLDNDSPETQQFVQKYKDKYGNIPDVISANSYDLMSIVCAIVARDVNSRENFRQVLSTVRDYNGVIGNFSFDKYGDAVREYYLFKIEKDGPRFLTKIKGD
ncbi:MAG: penicillin-binding protein activator [Candidatus Goldbacteria bacterium]|nr:penicillin-binding protein activator [Candidatus Goldiibacteriota bacterium]